MKIKKVYAAYFTGTGTTKKIVTEIAKAIDENYVDYDFSLPKVRTEAMVFDEGDLIIFGTPVIAGRVPNVLLKFLDTIKGNGAIGVPIVLYGNRNYDDALIELRDILEKGNIHTVAAGAFVGEHSFSTILGKGRPDNEDMAKAKEFAISIKEKLMSNPDVSKPIEVDGTPHPYRGYYTPRDRNGKGIDIRKVKPKTNDNCTDCKLCAEICPMGSINYDNVSEFTGICMKCNACIKRCPEGAKYYDDEGYLYHQHELEDMYKRRGQISLFI